MGWTLVVNDAKLTDGPAFLHRIVPQVSSDGGDVTLYEGQDTSGRSLGTYTGLANQTQAIEIGAHCDRGIYVDIGSDIDACLVVWTPLEEP